MATLMPLCAGLVEPKVKMLKFHWFYHYFLKGQEGHEYANSRKDPVSRGGFDVEKMIC